MTIVKKNIFVSIVLIFTLFSSSYSQRSNSFWSKESNLKKIGSKKLERKSVPKKSERFNLDYSSFENVLTNAKSNLNSKNTSTVVDFPNENGELEQFEIFESSIMEEGLQARFKNIRSFKGTSLSNSAKTIRFSITNLGLHAMILGGKNGTVFIDPETISKSEYIVYSKNQLPTIEPFECKFDEINEKHISQSDKNVQAKSQNADDGKLRTFRLAIATTGEYSQYHINRQGVSETATDEVKKAAVLSAIVTTMTRVNGIFERDVALTMKLIDDIPSIIFLNPDLDSFTNDNASDLIDESQTVIDSQIGSLHYDIGHTFSTGGGCLAQLNSPCTIHRARGITGSSNPIGDPYDIDYVCHEMGHQYGAHHTFNSESGGCNGNRTSYTAVEPGSGSTIMAYSGLCAPENIQNLSDTYFHQVSIQEMWANISIGNSTCAEITVTGNSEPVIESLSDYVVPISTPLVLDAVVTDSDGDALTFTWEQLDVESAVIPLASIATSGPAFRSILPTASSKRYLPNLETVLAGDLKNEWEVLPSVSRTMNFGLIARDNNISGGQSANDELLLTYSSSAGPFKVTSQNSNETWSAGTAQLITWDVANTDSDPVNCNFVNVWLSEDGGNTFPYQLASNIENNGSATLNIPNVITTNGKIKIESVGNIFYALNSSIISIEQSEFILSFDNTSVSVCEPTNAVYNFIYNTYNGFDEVVTFAATNFPEGTSVLFNPVSANSDGTPVEMTISNTTSTSLGDFNISVTGTSDVSSIAKTSVTLLSVYSSIIQPPVLVSPTNLKTGLLLPILLEWERSDNATSYNVQVSSEETFGTILVHETTINNNFTVDNLDDGTNYFWRVKSINSCGDSDFSSVYTFKTEFIECINQSSTDAPKNIPDNSTSGVSSLLQINNNVLITDVKVKVDINHEWIGDLTLILISPKGTEIVLADKVGDEGMNFVSTIFDDEATTSILAGTAPFTGNFRPQNSLSILKNEDSYGEWKLKVIDGGPDDTGSITGWSLDVCGVFNENYSFEIETIGETCPGEDHGIVRVKAVFNSNYNATLNGSAINSFTDDLNILNLSPGDYTLCITIEGDSFEQCYKFTIEEGAEISGKTSITSSKMEFEMEKGTAPYSVFANGISKLVTSSKQFNIDVLHGDFIEVKTSKTCEGVLSKTVNLLDEITVYPNPTSGIVQIDFPMLNGDVEVLLLNTQMKLVRSVKTSIFNGKLNMNIEQLPTGVYFGRISILNEVKSIKILKQ